MSTVVPLRRTVTSPPADTAPAAAPVLLDAADYARLAGLSLPAARAAIARAAAGQQPDIGPALHVLAGPAGLSVALDSLPEPLQAAWRATRGAATTAPVRAEASEIEARIADETLDPARARLAYWRWHILEPVLATAPGTAERTAAVIARASQAHLSLDGTRRETLSVSTLRVWLRRYEQAGLAGLCPGERKDKGSRRVGITRGWDAACPWAADDSRRQAVREALERYLRSEWASGCAGWRQVAERGATKLLDLSRAAGWRDCRLEVCALNRRTVEAWRGYQIIATHDRDAKQFFDRFSPSVKRDNARLAPNTIWFGDVHPLDIAVDLPDPTDPSRTRTVYPRAIAWYDPACNRVRLTLVPLAPREGIRREHVAASFAATCRAWGVPSRLYLDNGSEYSWEEMIDGFAAVSRLLEAADPKRALDLRLLTDSDRAVVRAMPYNAKAKAVEGIFSVLEQRYFSQLPGWTAGDRMNKRTAQVGRDPARFPGTMADLVGAVQTALDVYHRTPQPSGWLAGRSPDDALRGWIDAGHAAYQIDDRALMYAFSEAEARVVDRGYITWRGIDYYDDALLRYSTRRLTVRVARHDPTLAFCFDADGRLICAAAQAATYAPLDGHGARERARRAGVLRRVIREMRAHVDLLDLVEQMDRHLQHLPASPTVPVAGTVELSAEIRQMVAHLDAADAAATPPAAPALPSPVLDQWGSEPDPYLATLAGWDTDGPDGP